MADDQNSGWSQSAPVTEQASPVASSGWSQEPPPPEAPPVNQHATAQRVENKAREVQQAIENIPDQLHDAVFSRLSKYLPKSIVQGIQFASKLGANENPLSSVVDAVTTTASGAPQVVKGAAEAQQGGIGNVTRGVANVGLGLAKSLSPLAPEAASDVGEGLSAAKQGAKNLFTPNLQEAQLPLPASPRLQQAVQSTVDALKPVEVPHPSQIQPEFQQGLHDIVDQATRQSGGIPEPGQTLSGKMLALAQDARAKAKQIYQTIDNVTGDTDLKGMDDAIDKLKKRIGKVDFDKRAPLKEQLRDLQESFELVWDKVKSQSGLQQADLDNADNIHRKYRALQDVAQIFQKATKVAKEGEIGVPDANGIQQILDPTGLYSKLANLQASSRYGGQRLSAAFGPETAQQIIDHTAGGLKSAAEITGQAREAVAQNKQNAAALEDYLGKIKAANAEATKGAHAVTTAQNAAEKTRVAKVNELEKNRVNRNKTIAKTVAGVAGLGGLASGAAKVASLLGDKK